MLEVKLILCPIDFSEFSVRAYRYALSLAAHYHARLVALHVVELWRHPSVGYAAAADLYEEFLRALTASGEQQLEEFVKTHTHDGVQSELVVRQGTAADVILSYSAKRKTDVIVMGTHGRRGYDRLMLGSVTDRVMRRASCPVLAISKAPQEAASAGKKGSPEHRLRRILFCTDFSANSEPALNYALSITEQYDAELTLMHVLEDAPGPAKIKQAKAAAKERLDKLVPSQARKNLRIQTEVRTGKPYQRIVELAAEAQTDMVVMAVRGRGALDLAVFGSTTYRVMQLGACPVLAVHV